MIKQNILLAFMIGIIIGVLMGEHKTCVQLNGTYNFEYGSCKLESK